MLFKSLNYADPKPNFLISKVDRWSYDIISCLYLCLIHPYLCTLESPCLSVSSKPHTEIQLRNVITVSQIGDKKIIGGYFRKLFSSFRNLKIYQNSMEVAERQKNINSLLFHKLFSHIFVDVQKTTNPLKVAVEKYGEINIQCSTEWRTTVFKLHFEVLFQTGKCCY